MGGGAWGLRGSPTGEAAGHGHNPIAQSQCAAAGDAPPSWDQRSRFIPLTGSLQEWMARVREVNGQSLDDALKRDACGNTSAEGTVSQKRSPLD